MESLSLLWGRTDPFQPLVCRMRDAGQTARSWLGSSVTCPNGVLPGKPGMLDITGSCGAQEERAPLVVGYFLP